MWMARWQWSDRIPYLRAMTSFIGQLVEQLQADFGEQLGEICVVFPSKRACIFFKDHLSRQLDQPSWAPGIYAIEEFIREVHPRTLLDQVSLTFELYPIYAERFPDEPFDKFYSWGSMLIKDFDEVDMHLVEARQLFRNLFDLKEIDTTIEAWLNEDGQPTEFQQRYLQFWQLMGDFYERLHSKLDQRGMASPGMALREIAESYQKKAPSLPWQHVVFAGFNALAPAEEAMIKALVDRDMATCYWDLDTYYLDDPFQEAGQFYRELKRRWKIEDWNWLGNHLAGNERKITLTGVPQRVGQAKVAGLKLREWMADEVPAESTAVVLPDENLLFPFLHSLPEAVGKVNVTMGYPLRNTPLYSLAEAIIQLHESSDRLRPDRPESIYYFRDIRNILRHPYVNNLLRDEARELLREIQKQNLIYISPNYFKKYEEEEPGHLLSFLFQTWHDIGQVISFFLELYQRLKLALEQNRNPKLPTVETEYLFHFFTLTQKLRDKLDTYSLDFDLRIFRRLYRDILQTGSIPFSGEPLEGLQVMGMLETRVLDFDRLLILSVNEGVLPAKPNDSSFIPYSLRKEFGLPTHEDKDAIYAYHFYRLLQRAKEVILVYNTQNDTFGSGEKSRFIAQLEAELALRNPQLELTDETVTFPLAPEVVLPLEVPKTEPLLEQLRGFAVETGFSPSALSTYLNCPLQFYYRYILRLKEADEPEETMEEHTFGKVLHGALEKLYQPFEGKMVEASDIDGFADQLSGVIEAEFKQVTLTDNFQFGRNRLLLGVIKNLIEHLLEIDRSDAPFLVKGLELELETQLTTLKMPEGVKLRGFLDRVDEVKGITRIIDYKTGKVSRLDLKDFEEIREGQKKREPFQLSTYAYLFLRNEALPGEVSPGIYFMRNLSEGLQFLQTGPTKSTVLDLESLLDYESEMVALIDEIFDPELPFLQTEEEDRCRFCAYKQMCVRD